MDPYRELIDKDPATEEEIEAALVKGMDLFAKLSTLKECAAIVATGAMLMALILRTEWRAMKKLRRIEARNIDIERIEKKIDVLLVRLDPRGADASGITGT